MTEYEIREISLQRELPTMNERIMRLPEWRRRITLSYHFPIDRLQSLIAWEILADLLRRHCGLLHHTFRIDYLPGGRPVIAGRPDIHITLSHCPAAVMAAISDHPIGCDIEEIRRPYRLHGAPIADHFFTPAECRHILTSPDPPLAFTSLWTLKESLFKLTNHLPLPDPATLPGLRIHTTSTPLYAATLLHLPLSQRL